MMSSSESVLGAVSSGSSIASSSACGNLVLSCVIPMLLVASSIPAMMVKRNMEYCAHVKKQHAKMYERVHEISTLSEAPQISGGMVLTNASMLSLSASLKGMLIGSTTNNDRSKAFRLPQSPISHEPLLTLTLSDTSFLRLGYSPFEESVKSQLAERTSLAGHNREMASRSSPTLGFALASIPMQNHSQEAFQALDTARMPDIPLSAADWVHTLSAQHLGSSDTTPIQASTAGEALWHPRDQTTSRNSPPNTSLATVDIGAMMLPEEAHMILLSPIGLSDSQMIASSTTAKQIPPTASPSPQDYKLASPFAVEASGSQSISMGILGEPAAKCSPPLLPQGGQLVGQAEIPASMTSSSLRLSDPGELWDDDDESVFSFGASMTGLGECRNKSSIAESLLLRNDGELWDTDDEQLFSDVGPLATLSTYASLGITSLEYEIQLGDAVMVPVPSLPFPHTSASPVLPMAHQSVSTGSGYAQAQSTTNLAVSSISIPQMYSPSLASDDGFQMLEKNVIFELDEPIMNVRAPSLWSYT